MDSDDKFNLAMFLGLATLFSIVVVACTALVTYNNRRMAELGYEKVTVQGHDMPVWQKADKE